MRCDMRVFLRTRAFTLIACVFVMSSFISCISGGPGATPTVPVPDSGYTLGPEDVLLISVWKDEHLTREVVVRPDAAPDIAQMQILLNGACRADADECFRAEAGQLFYGKGDAGAAHAGGHDEDRRVFHLRKP